MSMFGDQYEGATFSPCRRYRYLLWRIWQPEKSVCLFIMLNPSTADESANDPTVAKCIRYAQRWGCGGIQVCNLFAFRATLEPAVMKASANPVGPDNDRFILDAAQKAGIIVCAWGNHGDHMKLQFHGFDPLCLRVTKPGEPEHPLYLKGDLQTIPYVREPTA